ncbi:MAG: hypothetical protein ACM3NT_02020 [Methylocystaceae bacterium]
MIVIVGTKRQLLRKVVRGLGILFILLVLVLMGASYLSQPAPVFNRFTEDRIPTGNPLRVNNDNPNDFDRSVEQFVIKLQDFYYEERE